MEIGQQQQIRGGGTSASIMGLEDAIDTAATNITRLQQSREQMELLFGVGMVAVEACGDSL